MSAPCPYRPIDDDGTRWVCTEPAGHRAPHFSTPCSENCRGVYPNRIGTWKRPAKRRAWKGLTTWTCLHHHPGEDATDAR